MDLVKMRVRLIGVLFVAALSFSGLAGIATAQETDPPSAQQVLSPAVGEEVTLYDMYEESKALKVTALEVVDSPLSHGPETPGTRVIAVRVSIMNVSKYPMFITPWDFQLVDDRGVFAEIYGDPDGGGNSPMLRQGSGQLASIGSALALGYQSESVVQFEEVELGGGDTVVGWFLFSMVIEAQPATLLMYALDYDSYAVVYGIVARLHAPRQTDDGAQIITTVDGVDLGSISIDRILTEFDRYDAMIDPEYGISVVALVATITNLGTETWDLSHYSFWIEDKYGYSFRDVYFERSEKSMAKFPSLADEIGPGETATGIILIEVYSGVTLTDITLFTDSEQLFFIGRASEELAEPAKGADGIGG